MADPASRSTPDSAGFDLPMTAQGDDLAAIERAISLMTPDRLFQVARGFQLGLTLSEPTSSLGSIHGSCITCTRSRWRRWSSMGSRWSTWLGLTHRARARADADRSVVPPPRARDRARRARARGPARSSDARRRDLRRYKRARHERSPDRRAHRRDRGRGARGAPRRRHAPGLQARRHLRRRVRVAHAVPVLDVRGRVRGAAHRQAAR